MKNRHQSGNDTPSEGAAPTLAAIRRQLAYLQEETKNYGYPEIALFLGCAVLAIDDLKHGRQRIAVS